MSATLPWPDVEAKQDRAFRDRWLSVLSHTSRRYGGLSSAVPRLSLNVTTVGQHDVALAAFCAPDEHERPAGFDDEHLSFWPVSRGPWLKSAALRQRFAATVDGVQGVHIHGLWEASTAIGSRTARLQKKPYIVSAHGMLEPWALGQKRVKKLLYAKLVEHKVIAGAACLHALTHAEADQYRAFGATSPIAVIPNAVEVPERLSAELFFERFPNLREKRLLLFLARLHPKKGLKLLVESWKEWAKLHPETHLVIAGPDFEGTEVKLRSEIMAAGLEHSVTFTGMLDFEMKWSVLAAAELFILPSYSEGLSMGALEAMGAGLPVIVTRGCNMPEVSQYAAGWEIDATSQAITEALVAAYGRTTTENRAMGRRGGDLITSVYNARHVAEAMSEVYGYVLHGIPTRKIRFC